MRRFWRVGIAQNALYFYSCFCGFAGSELQLLNTGGCGGSAAQDVAQFCTALWRESGLEAKIVKKPAKFVLPLEEVGTTLDKRRK